MLFMEKSMKMNKKTASWLKPFFTGNLLFATPLVSVLLLTACVHETDNEMPSGPGNRVTAALTFDIKTPSTDVRTRSALDAGALKIETVWIGVFDTKTGEMLGYMADRPRRNNNSRVRMNDDSGSWTVENMDIWYYDNNPEVYIASVVNYEFVKARKVGDAQTADLSTLLGIEFNGSIPEVKERITWNDLCAISVDTRSIDDAMKTAGEKYGSSPAEELALAMGFFNTSTGIHTTIDSEGNTPANAKVSLTKNGSRLVSDIHLNGRIYLRRMQSDVTVNINFSTTPSYDYVEKVNSLRYKVVNKPVEMYLAEHTVDQGGGMLSDKDKYLSRSANSADWLDEGYTSDPEPGSDSDGWTRVTGSIEDGYSFTYSHYENKHWGIDWEMEPGTTFGDGPYGPVFPPLHESDPAKARTWMGYFDELLNQNGSNALPYIASGVQTAAAHRIREAKLKDGEQPLFKSLNNDDRFPFNNHASYFIIEADLVWRNSYDNSVATGKYYYTIHEGYTSHADGSALPSANNVGSKKDLYDAICDFQTIRNTKYTYNLTLAGIHTVTLQAEREDSDKTMHDDGLTGETWRTLQKWELDPQGCGEQQSSFYDSKLGGLIYRFYDRYDQHIGEYVSTCMILPESLRSMDNRRAIKWRLYDKTASGVSNYGTFSGENRFEWPEYTGGFLGGPEALKASDNELLKQFYDNFKIHVGILNYRYTNYWSDEYYYDMESLKAMTIDEFLAGADQEIVKMYGSIENLYWFISYGDYHINDSFSNYPEYERGLYLVIEKSDDDGCVYSELFGSFEQSPYDRRSDMEYFGPFFPHYDYYENTKNGIDFNVYSATVSSDEGGLSNTAYIRWFAGVAENIDGGNSGDNKYAWDWPYSNSPVVEPTGYKLSIDGREVATIDWDDDRYRHPYSHIKISTYPKSYYFEYPIDVKDYEAGIDYEVVIEPLGIDENKVRPVEPIVSTLRILDHTIWKFDNETFPQLSNYSYFTYGGMTALYVPIYSSYDGFAELDGGRFNNYSYDNDSGVLRFTIDKHGTFRVRARNSANPSPDRYVVLAARGGGSTRQQVPYNSSTTYSQDFYLNTHDIIDEINGPIDVAIYSQYRIYLHEIEWIVDEDQRPGLNTSYFSYTCDWRPERSQRPTFSPFHNHYPYSYYFYLVPGMTTYFGFTDSNPRATRYKIGIYESTGSATPLFEQEFNADECRTWPENAGDGGTAYFVCPMYLPSSYTSLRGGTYAVAITPIHDDYAPSRPQFLSVYNQYTGNYNDNYIVKVPDGDTIVWWDDPYISGSDSYPDPFYYWPTSNIYFRDEPGIWWEYKGLVLHGGNGRSTTPYSDYIYFSGTGYPLANSGGQPSDRDYGCYLTFTTDRPGEVILMASSTGESQRYFRLYAVENGVPVQKDRQPVAISKGAFKLLTGRVDGPTEFILCPEGAVNLYHAQFFPNDEVDDRQSLNDSKIVYSNWSTDPGKPIHPSMYDIVFDYDDEEEYEAYRMFPLACHFESPIAFSDDYPRAASYKLQLFHENTFNPNDFSHPDFEADIDADTYRTYSEGGVVSENAKQVFTYPLHIRGDLASGYYLAYVTPVGDSEHYRPASPQFLTVILYNNWMDPIYKPMPPDDTYDDDIMDIIKSPYIMWDISTFAYDVIEDGDYPRFGRQPKDFVLGTANDFMGMTIKGSGTTDATKYVTLKDYDNDASSEDWWVYFPGSGHPYVAKGAGTDSNVGTGRNLSFTTDIPGKFVILAWGTQTDNESAKRYYNLYQGTQLIESKPVTNGSRQAESMKMIQLTTPETVSGPTEFIICPVNGSYFGGAVFFPKGCAGYDWNWEEDFPDEDHLSDGYHLLHGMIQLQKERTTAVQSSGKKISRR